MNINDEFLQLQVTFCDISVREIGNVNQKTVQCVLMINMFNEKIFLGIWFWLFLLGILTSINLLYWIITTAMPQYGRNFVKNSLVSIFLLTYNETAGCIKHRILKNWVMEFYCLIKQYANVTELFLDAEEHRLYRRQT